MPIPTVDAPKARNSLDTDAWDEQSRRSCPDLLGGSGSLGIIPAERGSVASLKHVVLGILSDSFGGCQVNSGHVDASLRLSAALVPRFLRVGSARPGFSN